VGSTGQTVNLLNTVFDQNSDGGGAPDISNVGTLNTGGGNLVSDNTGAPAAFATPGTPNANGDFVGTGAAPLTGVLGALGDNGGPRAGAPGSQFPLRTEQASGFAVNGGRAAGAGLSAPSSDERGFPRPVDGRFDIGASELQDFNLAVSTSGPPGRVHAGLPATLTLTVHNLGPNPSRGVTLTDTLPAGTAVAGASGGNFTVSGNVVTFAVPALAAGGTASFTLTVIPAAPGPFTATASASAHDDPDPANNTAAASLAVLPRPFPATGFADVTSLVQVTLLGKRRPRQQLVFLLTNVSGTPLQGPVGAMLLVPRGVKLRNAGGATRGGQKFVQVNLGGDGILDPGAGAIVQLVFSQPVNPRRLSVLAGAFA
jgi:uncharacterized repeat protein (TIGR01451 family)